MKALFITLSFLFAFAVSCIFAANKREVKVSEERKVEAFSSIEVASVATIEFTQSNTYSFKIEGKEELVKNVTSVVRGGKLIIDYKRDKDGQSVIRNQKNGVTIYLSAPTLQSVLYSGVGSFNCDTPLKLDDVRFNVEGVGKVNIEDLTCRSLHVELEGVGKVNIHVNCERLKARIEGVGHATLSGTAKTVDIAKDGIGGVNTSDLKIGK